MSTEPTVPLDPPNATAPSAPSSTTEGPRIRWAGIVWGVLFTALAVTALAILARAESRDAIRAGILAFDPSTVGSATVWGAVVIVLGVVLLIAGGLAMLRRRRA